MNFTELQLKLIDLTKRNITQSEIAKSLELDRSTVNIRTKKGSELKNSELKKISNYFSVSLNSSESSDFIDIPVRGEVEASMGYGVTVYNEAQTATYSISRQLANDLGVSLTSTEMVFARGNSMLPTIEGGDSLLVDLSKKEIYDGKIYCIRMDGQLYAKRLQKISKHKLKVISDNKDYEPVILDFSDSVEYDFEVIGEIRWAGRVFK